MGWNDRMDDPSAYGAQYARDAVRESSRVTVDADRDDENDTEVRNV